MTDDVGNFASLTRRVRLPISHPIQVSSRYGLVSQLTFLASVAAASLASRVASVVRRFFNSVSGTAIC